MGLKNHPINCVCCLVKWGFALALGCMLVPGMVNGQPSAAYTNLGSIIFLGPGNSSNTVSTPPVIDATNFVNKGLMYLELYSYGPGGSLVLSPFPYTTSSTLNFTNSGAMLGRIGWRFDHGTSNGRDPAANFYNDNYIPNNDITLSRGLIYTASGGLNNPRVGNPMAVDGFFGYQAGDLWIFATNIVNKGMLYGDAASEIKLAGTNVNLSRSSLQIGSISGNGSFNGVPTNTEFQPDIAIYDRYWGQTNVFADNSGVWNGSEAASPEFPMTTTQVGNTAYCPPVGYFASIGPFVPAWSDSTNYSIGPPVVVSFTNVTKLTNVVPGMAVVFTNIVHQAAFVSIGDPNLGAAIGFAPDINGLRDVNVELASAFGDTLFVNDTLAGGTVGLLANNFVNPAAYCSGSATFRPANYIVSRYQVAGFGSPGAGVPTTNFLFDPSWTGNPSTNPYAAYSCFVDDQASEPPSNPGVPGTLTYSSITNLPGRVRISANSLNLNATQLRGQGGVFVQANHLVSSQNASVDCENLSYNLGSTNGGLNVINLAATSVTRFKGTVSMWSALWTNYMIIFTTNYVPNPSVDSNSPPSASNPYWILSPITNNVQINLYALLVDAGQLSTTVPVTVYDFALHSTNMVISDSLSVVESFLLDGTGFALNGTLNFPGVSAVDPVSLTPFVALPIQNWVYTMAPTLLYFTNNGSLSVPSDAHFGDDGPTNYLAFVNNGLMIAGDQTIDSANLQINNAVNEATIGDFSVTAGTATFSNAQITAAGDIDVSANTLLVGPLSLLTANGALNITVTTNLSDGGSNAGNQFNCQNGFNLLVQPQTGELWGTTITSTTWEDDEVDTLWAGADLGATNGAGFTNNAALGTLVLSPQDFSPPYYPLFYFAGTGARNGLYVGTLDLSQLGAALTNMIQIDPSLTIYYAHALVDTNAIHLGTNIPPEIYLNGLQFPPGTGGYLRYVRNFTAFVVAEASISPNGKLSANYLQPGNQLQFTLAGAPGKTYVVQASTNLINWVPIYTNSTPVSGQLQFFDSQATNYSSRFYRTVLQP